MPVLPARVAQVARAMPSRLAIVDGVRRLHYGELWLQARMFAAALRRKGLQAGDRVALILPNRIEAAVAVYGTWLAGGVAVPLNVQARTRDLQVWLHHCSASHVVFEAGHADVETAAAGLAASPVMWELASACGIGCGEETDLLPEMDVLLPDGEEVAMILYTSGTTGAPKGVTLTHANLAANVAAVVSYLALRPDDRVLGILPFYYAYGASVLHTHLTVGAALILAPNLMFLHPVLELVPREQITGLSGVPSTFALLLDYAGLARHDLSSLRYITQAGGAMPDALRRRLQKALPAPRLYLMYGQTEATSRLCWLPPERLDDKAGSVGIPLPRVQLRIEREDRSDASIGEEGEVCVRGPNVMRGYWNAPEATEAALRDGWLHTGDLGYLDDEGFLFLSGRRSDMIKTGAHRIHPGDIEEVIAEIPGVRESAVVGIDDALLGQVVKAFVVANETNGCGDAAIKAHCRARLAPYKIPRHVEFVEALPRTASGKIRRAALVNAASEAT